MMAIPSATATATFTGPGNQGLQVGFNHGHIHMHERPETPPQPSCVVPFPRDPDFVDRGTLLDQIRQRCAAPAASRVALVGLGGVGKSQLAIEHCYRTAEQSPADTWVFWVHASNTARLEQSFREIADRVKARGRENPQADVFKLVYDWLCDTKNGRWLLVLDNADDAAVLSPTGDGTKVSSRSTPWRLSEYLPWSNRHGSVLVTSRTKHAAKQLVEESNIILIEPMHDIAAHALLRKKLGDIDEEDDSIAKLATTLDHMPLALVQAAAYIRERAPRCSVRQYLEEYWRSDCRKTSLLNQEAGHLRRDIAASNSILITWQISFDHLRSIKQSAAGLLSLMSFFDRQGIQEALLRRNSSAENDMFEEDLVTLRNYSFIKTTRVITTTRDGCMFEMHSLVQLAMRTWLENKGQLDKWREQFISNLCVELPTSGYKDWEKWQALFPHARAALAQRPKNRESLQKWAALLEGAACYAWQQGRADEAEDMATISMEVRRKENGEDSVELLSSMAMVGLARRLRGNYEGAEAILRQTLAGDEKVLGNEHPSTITTMGNLAVALASQGKYEEADAMKRETLARSEKILGHEHPHTLNSISHWALVLDSQGKYEEAEAITRQTLARKERVLGHEHPDTLISMKILADMLSRQGKYKEAEAMNRETLARREKVLGREHPDTLNSMSNLAGVLFSQGKYEEAEAMYRQALAACTLRREHPDMLTDMNNLAIVLNAQSKHEEAEAIHREALAGYKMLGGERPGALINMTNLAVVLTQRGKFKEAEAMLRQTLVLEEKILGHEHVDTLGSLYYLATLLPYRHEYDEALALYRRACAGFEAVLGKDHKTTRLCYQHYTEALKLQKQRHDAPKTIWQRFSFSFAKLDRILSRDV